MTPIICIFGLGLIGIPPYCVARLSRALTLDNNMCQDSRCKVASATKQVLTQMEM